MNKQYTANSPLFVDFKTSTPQKRAALPRFIRGHAKQPTHSRSISGAVRLSDEPKPRFKHLRKFSAGVVFAAGGILVTTSSKGTVEEPTIEPVTRIVADAPVKLTQNTQEVFADSSVASSLKAVIETPEVEIETTTAAPEVETATLVESAEPVMMESVDLTPPRPTFTFSDPEDALGETLQASLSGTDSLDTSLHPTSDITHSETPDLPMMGLTSATEDTALPADGTVSVKAAMEPPAVAAVRQNASFPEGAEEKVLTVTSGDTLSNLLNDNGVNLEHMPQLLSDELIKQHLSNLRIGQQIDIVQLANGEFHSLSTKVGRDLRITIRRSGAGFAVASIDLPVEKERVVTSGTIEQSLYIAAEEAHLKQSTIMELADIFQWELDFARDIRKGDHFSLVYDRLYREGKYIGDGDILGAEFVRGGHIHRAIRYTDPDGNTGYYSPDGTSKRRAFLRHPVDVVRITSKFDPNRLHPVLHQIRAHRGVDYGSPKGTPIRATANGVVKFSGTKGAYGNTVILEHGKDITTLYAHMSKISDKTKKGGRVKQGDVIGYVGATGRVTGAHLHYEFRKNNKHVDPLLVKLPNAAPVKTAYRDELRQISDEIISQMRSVTPNQLLANK